MSQCKSCLVHYSSPSNTHWKELMTCTYALDCRMAMGEVYLDMRSRSDEFVAIVDKGKPIGLCSRGAVGFLMGSLYGHSVYSRKRITTNMLDSFLIIVEGQTTWEDGLRQALSRPSKYFHDDVVVTDTDGQFLGLIAVSSLVGLQSAMLAQKTRHLEEDIEKRNQVEAELRDANQRLEDVLQQLKHSQEKVIQNERLSALGQMSTGIAHDFNNMLTPILGYCDLLIRSPEFRRDENKVLRYVNIIATAAKDAAQIINRLRQSYRPRANDEKWIKVDVNDLASEAIKLTQPRWKNQAQMSGVDITVITDLRTNRTVRGNPVELREALTNLIFNAADATPSGGEIVVRTREQGSSVILEIQDNGLGMSDEVRRRCMEPFFSTKGERGTGLGLTMVCGIVQRHNGEIEIMSKLGLGTSISIRLPVFADDSVQSSDSIPAPKPLRILVVDDEPMVREIVTELLSADAHGVVAVSSGAEALKRLGGEDFDLLFTDRCMPGMNGDELAEKAKHLLPDLPILMHTGVSDFMNGLPKGIDAVVGKPATLNDIRQAIEGLVRKKPKLSEVVSKKAG